MCEILLLDDDGCLLRDLVADILLDDGWNVAQAVNLTQAQKLLDISNCKLLMADHRSKQSLKSVEILGSADHVKHHFQDFAVIYITTDTDILSNQNLSPRERTLPKPFAPSELLELVQELTR